VFKNRLILALLVALAIVVVVLSTHTVSAGDGTGGHIGGIIAALL
jgi:preprotein translocase subunit SecG